MFYPGCSQAGTGARNDVNHAVAPKPTGVGSCNEFTLQLYINGAGLAAIEMSVAA